MTRTANSTLSETLQFEAQRHEMVALQIRDRGVRSDRVLAAMSAVPRHEFVPANQTSAAYSDHALPIGDGQTISQPFVVAAMTEALALTGSERVLEIGGGSGYQAAVLSLLAREVEAIEFVPQLADAARDRLTRLGFSNVRVEQGDGSLGWPSGAPYDAILVAAAAPEIPQPLIEQLADGGRLIIPVGGVHQQNLLRVVKRGNQNTSGILFACRFVPLRGRYGWPHDTRGINQDEFPGNTAASPSSARPSTPELSIVIPAYNEEARLPRALGRIRDYFSHSRSPFSLDRIEILVVDDGSTDWTPRIVEEWSRTMPSLRLVSNGDNRGKGYSVRHGMLEARGRLALFTDADLSSPIEELEKLLIAIEIGNDAAIGSRALDRSLIFGRQSRMRELAGMIFNGFVRAFTGLQFHDTQCGFKIFVRDRSRRVFEQQRIEGFGFDPEILFLAKRHGLRTAEIPVRWAHDAATKVHVVRDSLLMFGDLVYIRWNWLVGRYPKGVRANSPDAATR